MLSNYKLNEIKNKVAFIIQKRAYVLVILAIILLGCFLRAYHFSDWMRFQLDQARDANVISNAIQGGTGELPLLGPRARGTFLRLGPMFYYFEYTSAKILGDTPPAMAASVLFFSFLSLPLFFVLCRQYFSRKISAILLLFFSLSLFMIMYSRFAWNPNPLPFFALLLFLALLKAVDKEEKRKGLWLMIGAVAISIATQLHFLAFVILPIVSGIFLIIKRPRIKLKFWAVSVLIAILFYMPMLLNEYNTGGDNTKEFFKAVTGKSDSDGAGPIKSIYFNSVAHFDSFLLITAGRDTSNDWKIDFRKTIDKNFFCNGSCAGKDYSFSLLGLIFFVSGLVALGYNLRKERDEKKRDFLLLSGLWLVFTYLIFTPLASTISPRFFLVSFMLPFIFAGLILQSVDKTPKKYQVAFYALVVLVIYVSASETIRRFEELSLTPSQMIYIDDDKILKENHRVTYAQENMVNDYMAGFSKENGSALYYWGDSTYAPAFGYLLDNYDINYNRLPNDKIYRQGNYFFITFSDPANKFDIGKYAEKYEISGYKDFGTLTVLRLMPKEEYINREKEDFDQEKKKKESNAPKRYKWNEIFSSDQSGED